MTVYQLIDWCLFTKRALGKGKGTRLVRLLVDQLRDVHGGLSSCGSHLDHTMVFPIRASRWRPFPNTLTIITYPPALKVVRPKPDQPDRLLRPWYALYGNYRSSLSLSPSPLPLPLNINCICSLSPLQAHLVDRKSSGLAVGM